MVRILHGGFDLPVLPLQGKHFFNQFIDLIMGGLFSGVGEAKPAVVSRLYNAR
jgi:hypothetical protein